LMVCLSQFLALMTWQSRNECSQLP
jgi:hypothetical protein